jgi:DNA-binding transcriptional LysR family regulator
MAIKILQTASTQPHLPTSFDWTLVRSFVAVLDAGSLMGAARKLGAQQPTLSRHIAELEAQLGVPLFERTGRGVVPTLAAMRIAEAAREMEGGALALRQALDSQRNQQAGTVRISASQVVATVLLPPLIAELAIEEPHIQFEIVASDAITNLLRREADIAVRMVRPSQGSLIAKKLTDVPIVACAHRSYLERAGTPKRPADIFMHRLIGNDRHDDIIRGFAAMGYTVTKEHFTFRSDDNLVTGQMIAAGCGIGFAALYNLRYWTDVVPLLPMLKIPSLPCWLAVHREIRGNRIVRRTYDFLAERLPTALVT